MATENIPSRLHSVAQGNVVTGANEILDDDKGKKQSVINQENDQRLETLEAAVGTGGSVDSRIESAKTEIVGGASSDCNTLGKAEALISTNANDIAALQEAYAALTQNDVVVVAPADTWPVATPAQNIIYRVVDRTNTPPQYYTDYMWNGTAMVEMAQYNNAIDPRPKKASQNLVTSGGVFDNMGALDVSELNATENPHTLAKYVDLSAALAAVPTDYQKGGMSIKFVQSSDNKYVQYRLMSDSFNTTVANWQSLNVDAEPTAGSNNLVKSGGVYNKVNQVSNDLFSGIDLLYEYAKITKEKLNETNIVAQSLESFDIDFTIGKKYLVVLSGYELGTTIAIKTFWDSSDTWPVDIIYNDDILTNDNYYRTFIASATCHNIRVYSSTSDCHFELFEIEYNGQMEFEEMNGIFNFKGEFVNQERSLIFNVEPNKLYAIKALQNTDAQLCWIKSRQEISDEFGSLTLVEKGTTDVLRSPTDAVYLCFNKHLGVDCVKCVGDAPQRYYTNDDLRGKMAYSVNRSLCYALNVAVPAMFAGVSPISEFNSSKELEIRPWASLAFTLANQIVSGNYNPFITGHTLYEAKLQIKRFVVALAEWHVANKGFVAFAWGNTDSPSTTVDWSSSGWQTSLWAYYLGTAGTLTKELYTNAEWEKIVNVVEWEADKQVAKPIDNMGNWYWMTNNGVPVKSGGDGDSRAEEVAWDAAVIGVAIVVSEDAEKIVGYKKRFVELSCIMNSMPNDYQSGETINGFPTSELLGYNVHEDGFVINDGLISPGYSLSYCCSYMGAIALMMYKKMKVPVVAKYNMDKISDCLTKRDFEQGEVIHIGNLSISPIPPYGTIYKDGTWDIYYPQQNEWGVVLGITQCGFDAIVQECAIHPNEGWDVWSSQHTNLALSFQQRFIKGNYYKEVDEYTEQAYNAKESKYGTYTPTYISGVTFRNTPQVYSTSYGNELYEPTKLCIAIAFLTELPDWTKDDWYNNE